MNVSDVNPHLIYNWHQKGSVGSSDLDTAENSIGGKFPIDYREFLLLGGRLVVGNFIGATTDAVKVSMSTAQGRRHIQHYVGVVYDLNSALAHYRIFTEDMGFAEYDDGEIVSEIHERLPRTMFTIAHDNGDGWFLLDLSAENHGSIWHWQRRDITFGEEGNEIFGHVAQSFTSFIGSITDEANVAKEIRALERGEFI
jgi:hypothetical protein